MDCGILRKVEAFLQTSGMPAARFGRIVFRDPRWVFDLRNGRSPRGGVGEKIDAFIAAWGDRHWLDFPRASGPGRPLRVQFLFARSPEGGWELKVTGPQLTATEGVVA